MTAITMNDALERAGAGAYQRRLMGIFGLVWAADAMQVLAVGFTAASIAATFGLTVPQALQTGTAFFFGMLLGAAGFGRLADRYGRRRVLIVTVACDALFGVLSIFSPDFTILLVLRFLTGAAVGGTLPVDYAMMAEFLPAKNRGRWLVFLEGFWAVGTLIVALAAWGASLAGVADAWRYIFAVTAFPAVLGLGLRFLVPESPLYLLRTGRSEEAKAVVNRMLVVNGGAPLDAGTGLFQPDVTKGQGIFSCGAPAAQHHDPRHLVPRFRFLLRRLHLDLKRNWRVTVSVSCVVTGFWCWWRWRRSPVMRLPPMALKNGAASRR